MKNLGELVYKGIYDFIEIANIKISHSKLCFLKDSIIQVFSSDEYPKNVLRIEYNFDEKGKYDVFIVGKKRVKSIQEIFENTCIVTFNNNQKCKINTNFVAYYE